MNTPQRFIPNLLIFNTITNVICRYYFFPIFVEQLLYLFMQEPKQHIIKSALKLFLQKSLKAVTLRDIIKESGFSNGTFYYYFKTKQELFKEVANYYWDEIINPPFIFDKNLTLLDFIQGALNQTKNFFENMKSDIVPKDENINFYSFISEANRTIPGFREKTYKTQEEGLKIWTTIIENAKQTGEINSTIKSEDIAELFFTISFGHTITNDFRQPSSNITIYEQSCKDLTKQWMQLYDLLKPV